MPFVVICTVVGLLVAVEQLLNFLSLAYSLIKKQKPRDPGSWAIVTGCTDGIGQGFAQTLAKQGYNIVQISRSAEKLESNALDLKSKYGIQVKNIQKDFSKCTENLSSFFQDIYTQCQYLDVSLVVNNVGTSYSNTLFSEVPEQKLLDVLSLNIFPTVYLTSLFSKKLAKGGGIINLSSVLGNVKYEKYSAYCAVKAFIKTFSVCSDLDNRVLGAKVNTLCIQPGYVLTPLTMGTKGKFLVIDRLTCAESALNLLGGPVVSHGHWKHILAGFMYRVMNYKTFMLIKKIRS